MTAEEAEGRLRVWEAEADEIEEKIEQLRWPLTKFLYRRQLAQLRREIEETREMQIQQFLKEAE